MAEAHQKPSAALLILTFLVANGAVIKDADISLKRTARSPCETCQRGPPFPPPPPGPPPPPPPFFQTHQWSGLSRSRDGNPQGVFSGAAAAAEGGPQAIGQAFSIAASSVGSEEGQVKSKPFATNELSASRGYGSSYVNYGSRDTGSSFSGSSNGEAGHGRPSGAFDRHSEYNGHGNNYLGSNQGTSYSENNGHRVSGADSYKSESNSASFSGQNRGDLGLQQHQENSISGDGNGISKSESFSASLGTQNRGDLESQQQVQGGFSGYGKGIHSVKSFDHEYNSNQRNLGSNGEQSNNKFSSRGDQGHVSNQWQSEQKYGSQSGSELEGSSHRDNEDQSTLNGALGLASQGLQTAQQTSKESGCSTCSKGNYALSNAKSHSGSAVAISVGG